MIIQEQAMTDETRKYIWDFLRIQSRFERCVTAYEGGKLVGVLAFSKEGHLHYVMQVDETGFTKEEKKARIDDRLLRILDAVFGTGLPRIHAEVKKGKTRAKNTFSFFFPPAEDRGDHWYFTMTADQWAAERYKYGGQ